MFVVKGLYILTIDKEDSLEQGVGNSGAIVDYRKISKRFNPLVNQKLSG